jgi:protoporphyrinogen oxidase
LIEEFHYPRLGPGQMWEAAATRLAARGIETRLQHRVEAVRHDGARVRSLLVRDAAGVAGGAQGGHVISSMALQTLLRALEPAPPPEVLDAARRLKYRDFLTVGLIVSRPDLFPDNWLYIHSPDVKLGRIQNYKNWSPEMVADPGTTALGLEYFVNAGDALWNAADAELVAFATRELALLGLARPADVVDGCVIRMPKAYPVYDEHYQEALRVIRGWLARLSNLHPVGRNGLHRYNNQDHSMLTACHAVENLLAGERVRDVWDVNVEEEYGEERRSGGDAPHASDRQTPRRIEGA